MAVKDLLLPRLFETEMWSGYNYDELRASLRASHYRLCWHFDNWFAALGKNHGVMTTKNFYVFKDVVDHFLSVIEGSRGYKNE